MEWNFVFFLNSLLLGVGLAMDAFSVSLANGLNESNMKKRRMVLMAGVFSIFQGLMPLIGWVCVHTVVQYFSAFETMIPWIALVLLCLIGGKMLLEGIRGGDEESDGPAAAGIGLLLVQGIATSIDALSVGFTIAEYDLPMALVAALLIAAVTFVICLGGIAIGKKFGTKLAGKASIFGGVILIAIGIEIFLAFRLSGKVKDGLMGYEPDVFTAMYRMRDNILESLEEGILATDEKGVIQFANTAATNMLCTANQGSLVGKTIASLGDEILTETMSSQEKELNVTLSDPNIILNSITIKNADGTTGAIGILHNRAEYTKLMEDLSGTRYLVDSMRANNHDFTNKLHVILGLIQMEMYDEATSYIQNITMVQRENISKVMNAVNEPAVAALLIGKIARAAELNVHFVLREGCTYSASDMSLPSEMLVTVIGNLLDNAYDSMNDSDNPNEHKELMFGIYSRPGAVLITVDDTGSGIAKENLENIFTKGFSTKGEGRGTGLYQIRTMIESFGGTISVESQEGIGTSFSVSFTKE